MTDASPPPPSSAKGWLLLLGIVAALALGLAFALGDVWMLFFPTR